MSDSDIVSYAGLIWVQRRNWEPKKIESKKTLFAGITLTAMLTLGLQYYTIISIQSNTQASLFCGEYVRFLEDDKSICTLGEDNSNDTCVDNIKLQYQTAWTRWFNYSFLNTGHTFNDLIIQRMINSTDSQYYSLMKGTDDFDWNKEWLLAFKAGDKERMQQLVDEATLVTKEVKESLGGGQYSNDNGKILNQISLAQSFYKRLSFRFFSQDVSQLFGIDHTCTPAMTDYSDLNGRFLSWMHNVTTNPNNIVQQGAVWNCPFNETNFDYFTCDSVFPCSKQQWKDWCDD